MVTSRTHGVIGTLSLLNKHVVAQMLVFFPFMLCGTLRLLVLFCSKLPKTVRTFRDYALEVRNNLV